MNNSQRGYLNRLQGLSFEDFIGSACEYYKTQCIANIDKTPEPMKIIKPCDSTHKTFITTFEKKAQADYKGVLRGGKCIHFEAKSTRSDEIKQNAVSEEQEKDLNLTSALGGECFVLVSLIKENKFYKVPWDVWINMKQLFGHKYMNASDLAPYEIKILTYGLDFLGCAYSK